MNWLDLAPAEAARAIQDWVSARGEPAYRAKQILPRLWQRPVARWNDATELPRALSAALDEEAPIPRMELVTRQVSGDGTEKFLWKMADGALIESVLIPEGRRRTLCISSQAGCAFGCVFCATGRMGFGRHLTPGEIAGQIRELLFDPEGTRPTNIVFMGMGEPLHNLKAVDTALTIINDPSGLGIGARHITVSTVGIVPGLRHLAERPEQFGMALSLHSPLSDRRRRLMPVERKYPLDEVLKALEAFPRRVTFEYVMIKGMNDGDDDADALAAHARRLGALVNLLPLHPGGAPGLEPTPGSGIKRFAARVRAGGAGVTVRRSRGLDINAACGQLRVALEAAGVAPEKDTDVEQ